MWFSCWWSLIKICKYMCSHLWEWYWFWSVECHTIDFVSTEYRCFAKWENWSSVYKSFESRSAIRAVRSTRSIPECFSDVPGYTDAVTHSIPLTDDFKPKRLRAYQIPEKVKPEVDRQIQETLRNGIIPP